MENVYTNKEEGFKLIKAKTETIDFLLNYSKSLNIVEYGNMKFENNLN